MLVVSVGVGVGGLTLWLVTGVGVGAGVGEGEGAGVAMAPGALVCPGAPACPGVPAGFSGAISPVLHPARSRAAERAKEAAPRGLFSEEERGEAQVRWCPQNGQAGASSRTWRRQPRQGARGVSMRGSIPCQVTSLFRCVWTTVGT